MNFKADKQSTTLAKLKKAIIIGAGLAGLTAAYELFKRTDIKPVILERPSYIGVFPRLYGIRATVWISGGIPLYQ